MSAGTTAAESLRQTMRKKKVMSKSRVRIQMGILVVIMHPASLPSLSFTTFVPRSIRT